MSAETVDKLLKGASYYTTDNIRFKYHTADDQNAKAINVRFRLMMVAVFDLVLFDFRVSEVSSQVVEEFFDE